MPARSACTIPPSAPWREWPLPGDNPHAYAVYVDESRCVWLSDFGANALVRFDPLQESFIVLPLPSANASVRQLNGRAGESGAQSQARQIIVVRSRF